MAEWIGVDFGGMLTTTLKWDATDGGRIGENIGIYEFAMDSIVWMWPWGCLEPRPRRKKRGYDVQKQLK